MQEYIRTAGRLGYRKIFTCFLSVTGTSEEFKSEFTELCSTAHKAGMEVTADVNPRIFEKLGASPMDIRIFHEIGIDALRPDMNFCDMMHVILTHNP